MKDTAAPEAKPRARKKAMMVPAVSASWGRTFLQNKLGLEKVNLKILYLPFRFITLSQKNH